MRKITGLVALILLAAACGGNGSGTTSTAGSVTSSSAVVSTTPGDTTTVIPDTTSSTTTAAPTPGLGVELLVAGPAGVFLVRDDGIPDLLIDTPAAFAVDDLNGGVLFQVERWVRERQSIVYRVAFDGTAAVQTLVPTVEQGLALNGVAVDGDETYVYYSRNEGTTPEDAIETLRRYSLQTREVTELATIGGWEAGTFPISLSDSLVLYNWFAEIYGGMNFTDLRGNAAAVAANPSPPDGFEDCARCPRLGELSPDGTTMVYWEFDGGPQAVIKHVASGAEVRRIELATAAEGGEVVSFDLSAGHLVVNVVDNNDFEPSFAYVYDLKQVNPEPVRLSIVGEAYITLAPVTVRGVVPSP